MFPTRGKTSDTHCLVSHPRPYPVLPEEFLSRRTDGNGVASRRLFFAGRNAGLAAVRSEETLNTLDTNNICGETILLSQAGIAGYNKDYESSSRPPANDDNHRRDA